MALKGMEPASNPQ